MEMKPHYPFPFRAVLSCAVLLLLGVLSGCSRQPGLVGKWSGSGPIGSGTAAFTYDFHDDGLVETSVKTDKAASLSSSPMASMLLGNTTNIHVAGSYTVKGDVLTITPKSMTLLDDKGQPPPLVSPTVTPEPQIIRYKIRGTTLTLDRMDGDKPLALTRQKDAE